MLIIVFNLHNWPRESIQGTNKSQNNPSIFSASRCLEISFQRPKKLVSDSPGLLDFAIGLVNSVINLPDGQEKFFEEFKLQKNCEINLFIKTFLGLDEMMFGLEYVCFSLPEWQAVKMTFFAPWFYSLAFRQDVAETFPDKYFNKTTAYWNGQDLQFFFVQYKSQDSP